MQTKDVYLPIDLAKMYGLHSNTVRLYERMGYISPAQRGRNNYRAYTQLHVLQLKVCRCIFGYPFTNRRIRDAGNKVIFSTAKCQWSMSKQFTGQYIQAIQHEIEMAEQTANVLSEWKPSNDSKTKRSYSRKEAAAYFGITIETVRNWERNGLIFSDVPSKQRAVCYSIDCLERMRIIYMLRQAGYSMVAIHRSLSVYDRGNPDMALTMLNNPEYNDLVSVGDHWLTSLTSLLEAAKQIPYILEDIASL